MKVYQYGARTPTENADLVDSQIRRAHRYYTVLIGLERDRRTACEAAYDEAAAASAATWLAAARRVRSLGSAADEPLAELLDRSAAFKERRVALTALRERLKTANAEADRAAIIKDIVAVEKQLTIRWAKAAGASDAAWEIAWGAWATHRQLVDARAAPINERHKDAVREERGRCGTYWGTYLQIEDAVGRAIADTPFYMPLRSRHWDGSGQVAVQTQGGLSVEDMLAGKDQRVRIVGAGRHRHLWLRVGSNGREPVWAVVPIIYHRDLPPGSLVKWVRLKRKAVASHFEYSAQVILNEPPSPPKAKLPGSIAIDVGWRYFPGHGMRVATWVDDRDVRGELRVPQRLMDRWQKVHDLDSIRDKAFNLIRSHLIVARQREKALWPAWLVRDTEHVHAWRSPGRLSSLVEYWRSARFPGDAALFDSLEAWRKQDKHLWEWEAHQRINVLLARREVYRLFACQVAKYGRVVIEKLDLRDFAQHPAEGEPKESHILTAARGRRHFAALSEIFSCIAQAVTKAGGELVEVEPAHSTRTCSKCGSVENFDAGANLKHTCSACGTEWDQDDNASSNHLRASTSGATPSKRSKTEVRNAQGQTVAEARRQRGLSTRRAKRSRNAEAAK